MLFKYFKVTSSAMSQRSLSYLSCMRLWVHVPESKKTLHSKHVYVADIYYIISQIKTQFENICLLTSPLKLIMNSFHGNIN